MNEKRRQAQNDDSIQKTWVPEGTKEYLLFKQLSGENKYLSNLLRARLKLGAEDFILDVGGREGDIVYSFQSPRRVHLVDPDPNLVLSPTPAIFWNRRIQDLRLRDRFYSLILCSHVLGYLGMQNVQRQIITNLLGTLSPGGVLVLFYNTNSGYMGELLRYSTAVLSDGHFDYFDESIFEVVPRNAYRIEFLNVWFEPKFSDFESLSRCCWFLFGSLNQNIERVAQTFLPKLQRDLVFPILPIEQRVAFIERSSEGSC